MPRKQPTPRKVGAKKGKRKRFVYPKPQRPPVFDWQHVTLKDGQEAIFVASHFGLLSFQFNPGYLKEALTNEVQALMNRVLKGEYPEVIDGRECIIIEEEAHKAGVRYADPVWQDMLLDYSDSAYMLFVGMIPAKLNELPSLLVEQILYKIMTWMDDANLIRFGVKSGARRMWDDLVKEYGRVLKEDWDVFKPGPKEVTSSAERAEMLAFYTAQLELCQAAKATYKQYRKSRWRSRVKERHPDFSDEFIAHLADHKPSEVALLITGRHFGKIVGRDYRGLDELRRQLGLARKEAQSSGNG
jgi:hypothetical protein